MTSSWKAVDTATIGLRRVTSCSSGFNTLLLHEYARYLCEAAVNHENAAEDQEHETADRRGIVGGKPKYLDEARGN